MIATELMSETGWLSKRARQVWPPLTDFQSPPGATPTYTTFGSATTASMAEIRPVPPAGPMLRAAIPANLSALTCPMVGSATDVTNRDSARRGRSTPDVDVGFITGVMLLEEGASWPFKRRERGLCP